MPLSFLPPLPPCLVILSVFKFQRDKLHKKEWRVWNKGKISEKKTRNSEANPQGISEASVRVAIRQMQRSERMLAGVGV